MMTSTSVKTSTLGPADARSAVRSAIVLMMISILLVTLGGCSGNATHSNFSASSPETPANFTTDSDSNNQVVSAASRRVPLVFMQVSRAVKRNFIYSNDRPMVWPPITNIDGIVVGNCMTYSRMVQSKLRELGFSSRFRNVLAPVFPREHVVTVVTDEAGHDWVFDNRRPRPFPLANLSRYYDFEIGSSNAYVGSQRRSWRSVKKIKR